MKNYRFYQPQKIFNKVLEISYKVGKPTNLNDLKKEKTNLNFYHQLEQHFPD